MTKTTLLRDTLSLCPVCFKEIPAQLFSKEGSIYMAKECLQHGPVEALVEPDSRFYLFCERIPQPKNHVTNTAYHLTVTSRCNVRCKYCYADVDNGSTDPSIELLLQECRTLKFIPSIRTLFLFGAEPTVRDDLPELAARIREEGFDIGMSTNGLRLADKDYLKSLLDAGVSQIGFSLHPKGDNPPGIYEKKLQALQNCRELGHKLNAIQFTIDSLESIPEVLEVVREYRDLALHFRIRGASCAGRETKVAHKLYVSDILREIDGIAKEEGASFTPCAGEDNNHYHMTMLYDGIRLRLISWPTLENIDLLELQCGPWTKSISGRMLNIVHAELVNWGIRQSWLAGRPLT